MTYRKRVADPSEDRRPISGRLRQASELLLAGKTAAALTKLDEISRADRSPAIRSQVAALAAKSEAGQGRFADAAAAYERAVDLAPASGDAFLSPSLGQIRAQLKAVEIDAATQAASDTLSLAVDRWATHQAIAGQAAAAFQRGSSYQVDSRPPRPSVVAFRIGQQFWDEGEADTAAYYFGESIRLEPDGATRARIALARIALINEDFKNALDLARQALTIGQFHAKTLSVWPIVISAARGQGIAHLTRHLARGLAQATPTVRGRAKLVIARALRDLGDADWVAFTELEPAEDPRHIIAAEFAKMKLASAVQAGEPARRITQLARQLADVPNLAPREWLGAAKAVVTSRLAEDRNPGLARLLANGIDTYGPSLQGEFALGLANACLDAGQPDLAIPILHRIVDDDQGDDTWSRAASTLAKTLLTAGDTGEAIALFDRVARAPSVPERFQLYARLEWLRAAVAVGNTAALAGARDEILGVARRLTDFELLLDLARQMTLAPAEIAAVADEIFNRGERLAHRAFQAEALPEAAALIAFKLSRRQTDLGRFAAITTAWERLPEKKRLWLWSPQAAYWELIALVAAAYRAQGTAAAATALVNSFLTDPATPPEGLAVIGVPEALATLNGGSLFEALENLAWLAEQAPTHPLCGYAYYWFALRSRQQGLPVSDHLQSLRLAVGENAQLSWKRDLSARADLLAADLDVAAAASSYPEEFLATQLKTIHSDLQRW